MEKEFLMGIDVGTLGVKTQIFNSAGEAISSSYEEYPIISPKPNWAEEDPHQWWKATVNTIKSSIKKAKINPEKIVAIGVCGQMHGIVPIAKDGKPLYNAIIWLCQRSTPQLKWIEKNVGKEKVYKISGCVLQNTYTAPKILWLKENEPQIFKNTYKFLFSKDFINYKLSGSTMCTDWSMSSLTMLSDIAKIKWSEELCNLFDIPLEKLPEIHSPSSIIGEVCSEAATETGLKKGTPIVAGGSDFACLLLSVGVFSPERFMLSNGSCSGIATCLNKPLFDEKMRIEGPLYHVIPNTWPLAVGVGTTGTVLRWFRDEFCNEEIYLARKLGIDPYKIIDEEASKIPVGSDGLLVIPLFSGERTPLFNPNARGVFFGFSLLHTKEHVARAILEGVGYCLRLQMEILEDLGFKIHEMRAIGGAVRSQLWMQIQADILNKDILLVNHEEGGVLGAAILAGTGVGIFKDPINAIENIVKVTKRIKPRHEVHEKYIKLYNVYRKLYYGMHKYYDLLAKNSSNI